MHTTTGKGYEITRTQGDKVLQSLYWVSSVDGTVYAVIDRAYDDFNFDRRNEKWTRVASVPEGARLLGNFWQPRRTSEV